MNSYSQQQMVQQNCQEETTNSENPLQDATKPKGAKFSVKKRQGESGESQPTETADDAEARADFWSIQGDFIYRHHSEPRVQLFVLKEETFRIPMKYVDVTRSTHTDLHVMQEKRVDDAKAVAWSYDMEGHARKCVERYCGLANKKVEQLFNVSSPCLD